MTGTGLTGRELTGLTPNRLQRLARLGRRAPNQALERIAPARRSPMLLTFLQQTFTDTIDEAVDRYDRGLAEAEARAGRELDEFRQRVARATNETGRLWPTVGRLLLDPAVSDAEIRGLIEQQIPPETLRSAIAECAQIMRPLEDSYFDLLATRDRTLRQFAPTFLAPLTWRAGHEADALLAALKVLPELHGAGLRKVPANAPRAFSPAKWKPYVIDDHDQCSRRSYELCLLWELRAALRNGNLWIEDSRRYTMPARYLIAPERWPELRTEACGLLQVPEDGRIRFQQRVAEDAQVAKQLDQQVSGRHARRAMAAH